jgi:hypothetical protein
MGLVVGLAIPVVAVLGSAVRAQQMEFSSRIDVSLGPPGCDPAMTADCSQSPFAVIAADFDGDGALDVASANNFSGDVTVLLGDGKGGLRFGQRIAADQQSAAIVTGYLNQDESLDLVIANEAANTISVILGNGDGGFQAASNVALGPVGGDARSPEAVALADFNGDRVLDVATANLLGDTVSVLVGRGDGTFEAPSLVRVAGGPIDVVAAELTGDGNIDLAVALNEDNAVAVLRGDGNASFQVLQQRAPVGVSPSALIAADFDRDSRSDVAVASQTDDVVSVLLGRGDGTFAAARHYNVGSSPESLAVGNLNGDAFLDLVSADNFGSSEFSNSVSVLAGRSGGEFDGAESFQVHAGAFGVALADLNRDDRLDIIVTNAASRDLSILLNVGAGTLSCDGDCDRDGKVSLDELVLGVGISLGTGRLDTCRELDQNRSGEIEVHELVGAVGKALAGCPAR